MIGKLEQSILKTVKTVKIMKTEKKEEKFLIEFIGKGFERNSTIISQDADTARAWADVQLKVWFKREPLPKKIKVVVTPVLS